MTKIVFGMNLSLDGYIDHEHLGPPDAALFRHWIEHVRGLAASVYGRRMYETWYKMTQLVLDGFQAGLAWITILRKREGMRDAFDGFDPDFHRAMALAASRTKAVVSRRRSPSFSAESRSQSWRVGVRPSGRPSSAARISARGIPRGW